MHLMPLSQAGGSAKCSDCHESGSACHVARKLHALGQQKKHHDQSIAEAHQSAVCRSTSDLPIQSTRKKRMFEDGADLLAYNTGSWLTKATLRFSQ